MSCKIQGTTCIHTSSKTNPNFTAFVSYIRDGAAKKDLADQNDLLNEALDRLTNAVSPSIESSILDAAIRIPQGIYFIKSKYAHCFLCPPFSFINTIEGEKLKEKARKGDEAGARESLSHLADDVENMIQKAKTAAENESEPRTKKDLLDAIGRLEDLLNKLKVDTDRYHSLFFNLCQEKRMRETLLLLLGCFLANDTVF